MNKQELFEKALNEFDEWPKNAKMIFISKFNSELFCAATTFGFGDCIGGGFTGFKTDGDEYHAHNVHWYGIAREEFEAAKAERAAIKANWDKAPENATHALTAGKDWNTGVSMKGEVEFAELMDGEYISCGGGRFGPGGSFRLGDDAWVVLEARPEKANKKHWDGNGEPQVGELVSVDIYASDGEFIKGYVAHKGQAFGGIGYVVQCQNWIGVVDINRIHPIDTRTDKEKAIDDLFTNMEYSGESYDLVSQAYDKWVGKND